MFDALPAVTLSGLVRAYPYLLKENHLPELEEIHLLRNFYKNSETSIMSGEDTLALYLVDFPRIKTLKVVSYRLPKYWRMEVGKEWLTRPAWTMAREALIRACKKTGIALELVDN